MDFKLTVIINKEGYRITGKLLIHKKNISTLNLHILNKHYIKTYGKIKRNVYTN